MLGALIALLCINDVNLRTDLVIQDLAEVERLIDGAKLEDARELLDRQRFYIHQPMLRERILDLRGLLVLRAKQRGEKSGWVLPYFKERLAKHPTDPRFKAWTAEASLAAGNGIVAVALVNELRDKDLMPDAYAYVVLAKLSIDKQREAALDECRKRARAKSICVVKPGR